VEKFHSRDITALVIDDDITSRTLLVRLLAVMGAAKVLEATNGLEGLRLAFGDPRPHMIICDLHMEPIDGLAVLGAVANSHNSKIAAIPVIIFTATQSPELMQKAMQSGAAGAIPKPFNPHDLSEFLHHIAKTKVNLQNHLL
jgi:CheY-like chemotaxis protein